MLAYGARTLLVPGEFDDCLRLARESTEKLGVTLLNSVDRGVSRAGNPGNPAELGKPGSRRYGLIRRLVLARGAGEGGIGAGVWGVTNPGAHARQTPNARSPP